MPIKQQRIDEALNAQMAQYQELLTQQLNAYTTESQMIIEMQAMESVPDDISDDQLVALNKFLMDGMMKGENNAEHFKQSFLEQLAGARTPFGMPVYFPQSFQQTPERVGVLVERLMQQPPQLPIGATVPNVTYVLPEAEGEDGAVVVTPITFTEEYEAKRQEVGGPGSTYLTVVLPSRKTLSGVFNAPTLVVKEGEPVGQLVVPLNLEPGAIQGMVLQSQVFDDEGMLDQERSSTMMFRLGNAPGPDFGAPVGAPNLDI